MCGWETSQEGRRLGHVRLPLKHHQVLPTPSWVGHDGRPPSLFKIGGGGGGNYRETRTAAVEVWKATVSTRFGRCMVCVGGEDNTAPNGTTQLLISLSSNDAAGKLEGGGDG